MQWLGRLAYRKGQFWKNDNERSIESKVILKKITIRKVTKVKETTETTIKITAYHIFQNVKEILIFYLHLIIAIRWFFIKFLLSALRIINERPSSSLCIASARLGMKILYMQLESMSSLQLDRRNLYFLSKINKWGF